MLLKNTGICATNILDANGFKYKQGISTSNWHLGRPFVTKVTACLKVTAYFCAKYTTTMIPYLISVLTNKCPRCRKGDLFATKNAFVFKNMSKMNENCPVCGQATEIEVGFYYGTGYVSYALAVAFSVATFIAWKVLIGMTFGLEDNRIFYWFGTNATLLLVFQPLMVRLSRSLWLSWFVKYDKDWQKNSPAKNERVVQEHMQW